MTHQARNPSRVGATALPIPENFSFADWLCSLHWTGGGAQGGALPEGEDDTASSPLVCSQLDIIHGRTRVAQHWGSQHMWVTSPPCTLGPGLVGRPSEVSNGGGQEASRSWRSRERTLPPPWEVLLALARFPRKLLYWSLIHHTLRDPGCLPSYSEWRDPLSPMPHATSFSHQPTLCLSFLFHRIGIAVPSWLCHWWWGHAGKLLVNFCSLSLITDSQGGAAWQ